MAARVQEPVVPAGRVVLVIGANGRWAKAGTLQAARKAAFSPTHFNVYLVTPETVVSERGSLQYPGDMEKDAPILVGKY